MAGGRDPGGTTPFQKGDAEVAATASAYHAVFGRSVQATETQMVRLRRA